MIAFFGDTLRAVQLLLYSLCDLFQLFSLSMWNVVEVWQFLSFEPWHNMDVQVKDFLSCSTSVLLDDGDAVGFCCVFHGDCYAFD